MDTIPDSIGNQVGCGDYVTFPARAGGCLVMRFGRVDGFCHFKEDGQTVNGVRVAGIYREWDGSGFGSMNYTFKLDPRRIVKLHSVPDALKGAA